MNRQDPKWAGQKKHSSIVSFVKVHIISLDIWKVPLLSCVFAHHLLVSVRASPFKL
jgi:hypothetical protein